MVLLNGGYSEELVSLFHPSQLERKFGGEAEDLTVFWPPKEVSKEYGTDEKLFTVEGEENTEIHDDYPPSKLFNDGNKYLLRANANPNEKKVEKSMPEEQTMNAFRQDQDTPIETTLQRRNIKKFNNKDNNKKANA
jgi:hypothetical protein